MACAKMAAAATAAGNQGGVRADKTASTMASDTTAASTAAAVATTAEEERGAGSRHEGECDGQTPHLRLRPLLPRLRGSWGGWEP